MDVAVAETREEASDALYEALGETHILGLYTNLPLLRQILDQPFFMEGETYIDTIENWDIGERPVLDFFPAVAAAVFAGATPRPPEPLLELGAWRLK